MFSVNVNGRKVSMDLDLYYRNEAGEFVPAEELEMTSNDGSMTFGDALEALKGGKKVARKGWNGKGMFLTLQVGSEVSGSLMRNENAKAFYGDGKVRICPHIDMKAADGGYVVGWLASQTDMLADDWEIVE